MGNENQLLLVLDYRHILCGLHCLNILLRDIHLIQVINKPLDCVIIKLIKRSGTTNTLGRQHKYVSDD